MKCLAPCLILFASPVLADCEALSGLIQRDVAQAKAVFSPDPATCSVAHQTSGETLFCYAEHPFRSETATEQAERIEAEVGACFNAPARQADAEVNHPDSYTARWFDVEGARISLSVKDKGALGKTLVFLRVAEGE